MSAEVLPRLTETLSAAAGAPVVVEAKKRGKAAVAAAKGELELPKEKEKKKGRWLIGLAHRRRNRRGHGGIGPQVPGLKRRRLAGCSADHVVCATEADQTAGAGGGAAAPVADGDGRLR